MSTPYDSALGFVPVALPSWFSSYVKENPSGGNSPAVIPFNDRIAVFGDSRTNQCTSDLSGIENYGYLFWAMFMSRHRCRFRVEDNYGVGGDTTTMMLARIGQVKASAASVVIVLGGTNDRGSAAMTAAQTISNLSAIRDELRSVNKIVIFVAEIPRGDSVNTSNRLSGVQLENHNQVRQWILNQAGTPGVYVADPWPYMCDPASSSGDCKVGLTHDGLHPIVAGAIQVARPIADILKFIFPPNSILPSSNSDLWSTNNPLGCVNYNPMMAGTAGSAGTGGSGVLADSWSGAHVSGASGVTRTYSKVTKDDKDWQQCVLGGAASGVGAAVDVARQVNLHARVTPGRHLPLPGYRHAPSP